MRCRSRNRINVGTQAQLFGNLTVACHDASSPQIARKSLQHGGRTGLALRPPELSGRDAEHLTEMTRQMALVGKPRGKRNLR